MNLERPGYVITRFNGFTDPRIGAVMWDRVATLGQTCTVFQSHNYLSAWWETFGRGTLLILGALRDGELVALAPLFIDGGMAFFVGSGGSDYLDFIGDIRDEAIVDAFLCETMRAVPGLLGFKLYLVPDTSGTGEQLKVVSSRRELRCYDEGSLPAPRLVSGEDQAAFHLASNKKSLVRHERTLARNGELHIEHMREADMITPRLDDFFQQHINRWRQTDSPSLFADQKQQEFYRRLAVAATPDGPLRFTRILWDGRMIAAHFGFCHRGVYMWYKPSFDLELARYSPGEVLLRHLLLASATENAHTFDFGIGDEAFKHRFANCVPEVRTWGIYPERKAV